MPVVKDNSLSRAECACGNIKEPLPTRRGHKGRIYPFRCKACSAREQERLERIRRESAPERARRLREKQVELLG
jgi:hypothetical protein